MIIPPIIHIVPLVRIYMGNTYICPTINGYNSIFMSLKEPIKKRSIIYALTDATKISIHAKTVLVSLLKTSPIAAATAYDTNTRMVTVTFSP